MVVYLRAEDTMLTGRGRGVRLELIFTVCLAFRQTSVRVTWAT